jgi:hypothetical protein
LRANVFPAERKLVLAQYHVHIVCKREGIYVEMSRGTGAAVGAPLVGDGQFQEVGARRVGVDAKRSGADALGGGASVVTPSGGRSMKRIDRMIVDDIGLTDGKSLRALIVPRW